MTFGSERPVVVVPCYDEERRLDTNAFRALAGTGRVELLFVDDGSTDATGAILAALAARSERITVLSLPDNTGKAEAVRRGMLLAVRNGAQTVGYLDADLATPPPELLRLVDAIEGQPELAAVLGSRVARLGSTIERQALRHYLGRLFATLASAALGVPVYDTQCGAKLFRVDESLAAALVQPFRSAWSFDVELLDRLLHDASPPVPVSRFLEVPLEAWTDVGGSKLRPGPALGALATLVATAMRRRRRRAPAVPVPLAATAMRPPAGEPRRAPAATVSATDD